MIRWSYGINQFKPQFDDFVRRRDHQRALRVISISGFSGVELQSGTGRWEPLGNPHQITSNFGSVADFGAFVREAALDGVSSWVWDPLSAQQEDLTRGSDPVDPSARELLVQHATWYGQALAELGGSVLVARPCRSAGSDGGLDDVEIAALGYSWNAVAERLRPLGVRLGLHLDFMSALRADSGLERLLAATDPDLVGLTIDTAEFTIAGIDPVAFYRRHAGRVVHVQLKNCAALDTDDEYLQPAAEYTVLRAGGARRIPRWFVELGADNGHVDTTAFVAALVEHGYDGWAVVESDLTPHPATSVMLNGWQVQHILDPLTTATATHESIP
jgi:inosose dehydratase